MNIKLIVMDIDGTILKSNHNVSNYSRQILDRAREAGLHVTLASGRNFTSMLHIAQKLGIQEPIITNDGGLIKDPNTNKVYLEEPFDNQCLKEMLEVLHSFHLTYTLHMEEGSVSNRKINYLQFLKRMGLRAIAAGYYEKGVRFTKNHNEIIRELSRKGAKAYKVTTLANDPEVHGMEESTRWIQEHYAQCAKISYSGLKNFDILPNNTSKVEGLKFFQKHYGIAREEIMAFGDSFNDIEMLEYAGFGVAMGNASDKVKSVADFVTKTNNLHGVAYAIEKFVLKKDPLT